MNSVFNYLNYLISLNMKVSTSITLLEEENKQKVTKFVFNKKCGYLFCAEEVRILNNL